MATHIVYCTAPLVSTVCIKDRVENCDIGGNSVDGTATLGCIAPEDTIPDGGPGRFKVNRTALTAAWCAGVAIEVDIGQIQNRIQREDGCPRCFDIVVAETGIEDRQC